ncbi:MAG: SGNH/GDSL hydrolase family protein [Acidimicrobiales bacterium]
MVRTALALALGACLAVGAVGAWAATGGDAAAGEESVTPSKPLAVIVGASITAGEGAMSRTDAWPYVLAKAMGWRVAVRGVPGAGYVRRGVGGGPFLRELVGLGVLRQHPSVVILQGGHDDVGVAIAKLERAVAGTVGLVVREAPNARLVLLTVFPGGSPTRAQLAVDRAIVATARRIDPDVVIVDPITQHWHYATIKDHLHPTDAGHRWIARRMEHDLEANKIYPASANPA